MYILKASAHLQRRESQHLEITQLWGITFVLEYIKGFISLKIRKIKTFDILSFPGYQINPLSSPLAELRLNRRQSFSWLAWPTRAARERQVRSFPVEIGDPWHSNVEELQTIVGITQNYQVDRCLGGKAAWFVSIENSAGFHHFQGIMGATPAGTKINITDTVRKS